MRQSARVEANEGVGANAAFPHGGIMALKPHLVDDHGRDPSVVYHTDMKDNLRVHAKLHQHEERGDHDGAARVTD
jgi:hypothetical protein